MHDMNTPDRRNAGYVSTLFASEPGLLGRLVDAVTTAAASLAAATAAPETAGSV